MSIVCNKRGIHLRRNEPPYAPSLSAIADFSDGFYAASVFQGTVELWYCGAMIGKYKSIC